MGFNTVKASSFGLHGNFGPFFQRALVSSKRVLPINKWIKVVDKLLICKVGSVVAQNSHKEARHLARNDPKQGW
jgi:hypothetical protein